MSSFELPSALPKLCSINCSQYLSSKSKVPLRTCRDFDQLRKTVADLCSRESSQECEVQEGVDGCVICTQPVLVVALIDGYFDRDRRVDQADHSGGDSDEVGVAAVCNACEPVDHGQYPSSPNSGQSLPSHVSDKSTSYHKNWFLVDC